MERAWVNLLRDGGEKAQSSCIDLRVQGELDQFIDGEEQK